MFAGKRIILGVTGGIAAYKAALLLRAFQKAGAEVRITMTPAATQFVGVETFASLSENPVAIEIFPDNVSSTDSWTRHIDWGEWADLFVIAPCTANSIAKIAHGISDNMLTATVIAARCPLLICPTMDGAMYEAAATQKNLENLQSYGYNLLHPEEGYLASGLQGKGRLPEIETILKKCESLLTNIKGPLSGKKVLVTTGPTREHIDPVRFISNPSSGKMGFAMAKAAQKLGAEVTLLHGPVSLPPTDGILTKSFENAAELFGLVKDNSGADVIIMAAAVSDFTPEKVHEQKVKKEKASSNIALKPTRDILLWLGERKKSNQILIGFAMETENLIENASKKRKAKNVDWILANSLSESDSGFSTDTNTIYLLGKDEHKKFSGAKKAVARQILDFLFVS